MQIRHLGRLLIQEQVRAIRSAAIIIAAHGEKPASVAFLVLHAISSCCNLHMHVPASCAIDAGDGLRFCRRRNELCSHIYASILSGRSRHDITRLTLTSNTFTLPSIHAAPGSQSLPFQSRVQRPRMHSIGVQSRSVVGLSQVMLTRSWYHG